jgi:hypothetical protein
MKNTLALIAILLCWPSSANAQAQPHALTRGLRALGTASESAARPAVWLSLGADLGTTWYAIRADGRSEANPIMGQSLPRITATAIGVTALAEIAARKLEREHRRTATVVRWIVAGVHVWAAARNVRTGARTSAANADAAYIRMCRSIPACAAGMP